MVDAPIFRRYQTPQCFRLSSENIGSRKAFLFRGEITNTMTLKGTGRENMKISFMISAKVLFGGGNVRDSQAT